MVLLYVDDILCIHKDILVVIDTLESIYVTEQGSIRPPECYLGENTDKVKMQNIKVLWDTHSVDYCKAVIANLEKTPTYVWKILSQYGDGMHQYPSILHPEIETSIEID